MSYSLQLISLFLLLGITACEPLNLEEVNFLEITLDTPTTITINAIAVQGQITGLVNGRIEEHGLTWSSADFLPTVELRDSLTRLGTKTINDNPAYIDTIYGLRPNTRYLFRAYAVTNDGITYSDTISYQTGRATVITQEAIYESGFSIDLVGQLNGTEAGLFATSHGFCWSSAQDNPVLDGCCTCIDLGNRSNNLPFSFTLSALEDGMPYYFQAFAVINTNGILDTVYGGVIPFDGNLNDFWLPKTEQPAMARCDAVAFAINGKAYFGTGMDGTQVLNDFWEYDPSTNTWTPLPPVPGPPRTEAIGFSIETNGKGYVGLGWSGNSGFPYTDFYEFDPVANAWTAMPSFPSPLGGRRNAVSFTIGSRGYICSGYDNDFQYSKECWAFDPNGGDNNSWIQQASMGKGRIDAVAFAAAGKGYVLTGWQGNTAEPLFKDFWAFDPAIAPNGQWTQKDDFPGVARAHAVAFSFPAENRGFVSTGWSGANFQLSDLWEYNPTDEIWTRKADLPQVKLRNAVGLAIEATNKAYVGAGGRTTQGPGCADLQDNFWEYDSK